MTAVDSSGQVFAGAVVSNFSNPMKERPHSKHPQEEGDLWYFPPGIPHSLQASADDPAGSEFLLVIL